MPRARNGFRSSGADGRMDGGDPRAPALPAGRLERMIGKPATQWALDDLVDLFMQAGVRLVSLMHVGGDGWLKTLDFVPRNERHLRDVLSAGERADGSSLFRGMGIRTEASDILLRPRLSTAFLDPFSPLPTLVLLCGHVGHDGHPLPESPDTIVRAAFEHVRRETGLLLHALGEVEFFLGKRSEEADIYGADDRGYHAASPFVFGEALRREALVLLSEIGVPVKYGHSEVGYVEATQTDGRIFEQHEIELALSPLPNAADAVLITQWVLRNLAHERDMLCTFDPILVAGHAGSGLHIHFSPVGNGAHLGGYGPDGDLHPPAKWLIAGLVQLGGALMAFGNRSEGSLVRLRQGKEAPNTVVWGARDRKALVRLPLVATTEDGEALTQPTIELRLPDGSAHPHLLLAAVAQALIHGRETPKLDDLLERTRSGRGERSGSPAAPVPSTFLEIADTLRHHRAVFERGGVFPPHVLETIANTLG